MTNAQRPSTAAVRWWHYCMINLLKDLSIDWCTHQFQSPQQTKAVRSKSTKWQPSIKSHGTSWIISSWTRKECGVAGIVGALDLPIFSHSNPIKFYILSPINSADPNIANVLFVNNMFTFFCIVYLGLNLLFCHLVFCLMFIHVSHYFNCTIFYNGNIIQYYQWWYCNIFTALWRFCCCYVRLSIKILQCNCFVNIFTINTQFQTSM